MNYIWLSESNIDSGRLSYSLLFVEARHSCCLTTKRKRKYRSFEGYL